MMCTATLRTSLVGAALAGLAAMPLTASAELGDHLKFFGDFRGRYEGIYYQESGVRDRNRGRYRLRAGVDYEDGRVVGAGVLTLYRL
jgi:hypothetical protein